MPIPAPSCDDVARLLNERRLPPAAPSWLARLFGARPEEPIRIHCVHDAGFEDLFATQRFFYVTVRRLDVLPLPCLPGGSWGYLGYDGTSLRLLSPSLASVTQALRRENVPIDQLPAERLAEFMCAIALKHHDATGHALIASAEALLHFGQENEWEHYEVNQTELARVAEAIVAPSATKTEPDGWQFRFTTVFGWMHSVQELGIETLEVRPDFAITRLPRRVLSKKIFARVPSLIY